MLDVRQDLSAGVDWNRQTKHNLAESHLLVLLFTTPALNWDWCLFEVGLFTHFEAEDVSSVVLKKALASLTTTSTRGSS